MYWRQKRKIHCETLEENECRKKKQTCEQINVKNQKYISIDLAQEFIYIYFGLVCGL